MNWKSVIQCHKQMIESNQDSEDWELHLANCVLQDFCRYHELHKFFSEWGTKTIHA